MSNSNNKVITNMILYTDESSHNIPAFVYAKQFDYNSRFIVVKLMCRDGQISIDGSAKLNATKINGDVVSVDGTVNSDGTIMFALVPNLLTDVGCIPCDVSTYDSENHIQSFSSLPSFFLVVEKTNNPLRFLLAPKEYVSITNTSSIFDYEQITERWSSIQQETAIISCGQSGICYSEISELHNDIQKETVSVSHITSGMSYEMVDQPVE